MNKRADRWTSTACALAKREPLDVTTMSISDLIVALSATEDQLSEWRGTGSAPPLNDPLSDHRWVIAQQGRIVRELRSRRQPTTGGRRRTRVAARGAH